MIVLYFFMYLCTHVRVCSNSLYKYDYLMYLAQMSERVSISGKAIRLEANVNPMKFL